MVCPWPVKLPTGTGLGGDTATDSRFVLYLTFPMASYTCMLDRREALACQGSQEYFSLYAAELPGSS